MNPVPNTVIYGFPPIHTSGVTAGVSTQGPPIINQITIPYTDEDLQDEYEMKNYHGVAPVVNHVAARDFKAIIMCRALAKKLRVMEGHSSTSLSALEMCLVTDVVILPKFKEPEFEKYKGLDFPNIHKNMYFQKMVAYAIDDKLMVHCF